MKLIVYLALQLFVNTIHAEVFKCVNSNGKVQYQGFKCSNSIIEKKVAISKLDPEIHRKALEKLEKELEVHNRAKELRIENEKKLQDELDKNEKINALWQQNDANKKAKDRKRRTNQQYSQYYSFPTKQRLVPVQKGKGEKSQNLNPPRSNTPRSNMNPPRRK